ncbi:Putative NADPH-quinone reductase (modulator of drug activity B) [Lentibacillus halodurans]|uniref:Putative NADPH-quinone reductase (Modulator of drug activity B) n=1 Tax=Lentibacillus halodurans TaxID=237679 RepID=A0A1I0ZXS2_9BACI|nr:NAD(P)H-dependent oxidoreductase [Lentibacillus halodurans]SFB30509.1 Putative NADPH-quinone reductase (modulator of drug activity B) [Lentibacillus halodurans]
MKTLLIVSHPDILESSSQQFFLRSVKENHDMTIHHLEGAYPDYRIDIEKEQALLKQHDRILFQFPFYWYSSPPLIKHWQDVVLEDGFAYGERGKMLSGKEFGLILMIGISAREYQAGGTELFSINELTKPFQAMAHKTGMIYLKPFTIYQFAYMEEEQKMEVLIKYWQMLTMENDPSLASREKWLIAQLEKMLQNASDPHDANIYEYAISLIKENRNTIDGLKVVLDQMQQH